jgi:hypothetical protein
MPTDTDGNPVYPDLTETELHEVKAFIYGLTCQSRLTPARIGILLERLLAQYQDYRTTAEAHHDDD